MNFKQDDEIKFKIEWIKNGRIIFQVFINDYTCGVYGGQYKYDNWNGKLEFPHQLFPFIQLNTVKGTSVRLVSHVEEKLKN